MTDDNKEKPVFWRRFLAFLIDIAILSAAYFLFCLLFSSWLVKLGLWTQLLGYFIFVLYHGLMNSRLCGGRTLGKMITKIKVVDNKNQPLSACFSLLRSAILGAPIFLNNVLLPAHFLLSWPGVLAGMIVFGLGGAIFYLFVFNFKTRQSFHDVVVGSFVKSASSSSAVMPMPAPERKHWFVVGAIFLATIVISSFMFEIVVKKEPFISIYKASVAIESLAGVQAVRFTVGSSYGFSTKKASGSAEAHRFINLTCFMNTPHLSPESFVEIGKIILENFSSLASDTLINMRISHGVDMGLARLYGSKVMPGTLDQLRNTVKMFNDKQQNKLVGKYIYHP